jgi:hypothetical protein
LASEFFAYAIVDTDEVNPRIGRSFVAGLEKSPAGHTHIFNKIIYSTVTQL